MLYVIGILCLLFMVWSTYYLIDKSIVYENQNNKDNFASIASIGQMLMWGLLIMFMVSNRDNSSHYNRGFKEGTKSEIVRKIDSILNKK